MSTEPERFFPFHSSHLSSVSSVTWLQPRQPQRAWIARFLPNARRPLSQVLLAQIPAPPFSASPAAASMGVVPGSRLRRESGRGRGTSVDTRIGTEGGSGRWQRGSESSASVEFAGGPHVGAMISPRGSSSASTSTNTGRGSSAHVSHLDAALIGPTAAAAFTADVHAMAWPAALRNPGFAVHGGAGAGEGGGGKSDAGSSIAAASAAQLPSNTTGPTTASGSKSNSSVAVNSGVRNRGSSGRGGGQRPSSRRPTAQIRIDRIPPDTSAETVATFVRDTLGVIVDRVKIKGYTRIRALPAGRATASAASTGGAAGAGERAVVEGTRYREEWVSAGYGYADFLTAEVAEFVMAREEALVLKGQQLALQCTMEQRREPEGLLSHANVHLGSIHQPGQLALTWRSKPESCRVEFDFLERRVRVVVQAKAGERGRGGAGWGGRAAGEGGAREDAGAALCGGSLASIPLAFQRVEYKLEWRMRDVRLWGTKDGTPPDTDGPGLTSSLLLLLFVPPAVFSRACDDDVWQLEPDRWFPDDGDPWTRTTDEHFLPAGARAGACTSAEAGACVGVGDDGRGGAGAGRWDSGPGSGGGRGVSGWKGLVWSGGVLGAASVMQVSVSVRHGIHVRRIAEHMRTASLHLRARYLGDPPRVAITAHYAAAPPIHLTLFISLDPSWLPNTTQGTVPPTAVTASLYRTLAYEPVPAAVAVLIEFLRFSRPEFDPARKFCQIARAMRHHGRLQTRGGTDTGRAKEPEGTREHQSERGAEQQGSVVGELELQPQSQQEQRDTEEKAGEASEGESSTWPWRLPANHVVVFRLLITPLGAQCCMPGVELTNRVLTHYCPHAHRFLRVTFTDEGLKTLSPSALRDAAGRREGVAGHTDVYRRILSLVEEGFSLCGRHYRFLASSASQLREKSAWFLAEDDALSLTVASVQAWMGTFSAIRNVAKCAARMGQCFSARFTSLPLPRAHVRMIPDVTRGNLCFTDGVGAVSPEAGKALADAIAPYLDRPQVEHEADPHRKAGGIGSNGGRNSGSRAAIAMDGGSTSGVHRQVVNLMFRQGDYATDSWMHAGEGAGASGSSDVHVDAAAVNETLPGVAAEGEGSTATSATEAAAGAAAVTHMWIRPSMVKFESQHADVEVVNWTRPLPCFLNREIITLLSTLGVPDHVFLHMQVSQSTPAPFYAHPFYLYPRVRSTSLACLRLAREAAIAFDFPKTGVAGQMPHDLRVQEYPDFMEKGPSKETYESNKVLGRLYRAVKDTAVVYDDDDLPRVVPAVAEEEGAGGEETAQERREWEEEAARQVQEAREVREGAGEGMGWEDEVAVLEDGRTRLQWARVEEVGRAYTEDPSVEGFEQHVQEDRELKWAYDRSMLHILHQFGIMTEAEVATGSMLQASHRNGRKDDAVREQVRNMFSNLHRHYHRLLVCGAKHGGEEDDDVDDDSSDASFPAARTKQQQQKKDPRLRVTPKVNVVQGIKAMVPDAAPTAHKPSAEHPIAN
ncbi:unnamed protein product [Closterium sp. NIES-65]|nr:unnamed protein product [Closterium sp. NIES-65]